MNFSLKLNVKSIVELNLYTESGLAKIAIGAKLVGSSESILESDKKYKYTSFSRSTLEHSFTWNEDFHFQLNNVDLSICEKDEVFIKFRLVEEGPKAVMTIPYDSRSASPVYEILPEKQRRSIIAYGRIPVVFENSEVFRRIDLYEVASDEKCGELAIAMRVSENRNEEKNNDYNDDNDYDDALEDENFLKSTSETVKNDLKSPEIHQPELRRAGSQVAFLDIPRIPSTSTVSTNEPVAEANIVLNEHEAANGLEVTSAEVVGSSGDSIKSVDIKSDQETESGNQYDVNREEEEEEIIKEFENALRDESEEMIKSTQSGHIVGLLNLEIVAAQRLPKEKRFLRSAAHQSNPFVTISFGKKSFRTKVKRNTCNPIWREKLAFSVKATEMSYQVMFSVYDYESLGYNSCLATANIRTSHFIANPEQLLKLAVPLNVTKAPEIPGNDACLLIKGSFLPYEKVRKNFWTKLLKAFDLNHNGYLCKLEFETMLESLGSTLSEATISKVFSAVEETENQEISIEEAVKVLEDLTVHSPNKGNDENDESVGSEKIVILSHCPFCRKYWNPRQEEIDVITHLGICSASESTHMDKFVMGGFLTEEYASRKWFARLLSFMSFGNYRIGRNNGNILVQDRKTGKLIEEKMPTYIRLGIRMLHQNIVTYRTAVDFGYVRNVFQSLTIQQGKKFDHPSSVNNIPPFIRYHKLPVHEIADPLTSFKSFNEFFYRRIKLEEYRPLASPGDERVAVSPADCRLNVFESVSEAKRLWIKGVNFDVASLLKDKDLAEYFDGGSLVIARLAPQDYHRFHSPVEGTVVMNYHIPGTYYTVNPMAVRQKVDVFTENARTVTIIDSPQFGKVAYVSIGAMMVGSIIITAQVGATVARMSEIGYFAFGGSTIVLLFCKGARVKFDEDLLNNSREQLETLVKVGESMGHCQNE